MLIERISDRDLPPRRTDLYRIYLGPAECMSACH